MESIFNGKNKQQNTTKAKKSKFELEQILIESFHCGTVKRKQCKTIMQNNNEIVIALQNNATVMHQ